MCRKTETTSRENIQTKDKVIEDGKRVKGERVREILRGGRKRIEAFHLRIE